MVIFTNTECGRGVHACPPCSAELPGGEFPGTTLNCLIKEDILTIGVRAFLSGVDKDVAEGETARSKQMATCVMACVEGPGRVRV